MLNIFNYYVRKFVLWMFELKYSYERGGVLIWERNILFKKNLLVLRLKFKWK